MLDFHFIATFLFKLTLTLYIVSHAFNLQSNPQLFLDASLANLQNLHLNHLSTYSYHNCQNGHNEKSLILRTFISYHRLCCIFRMEGWQDLVLVGILHE